MSKTTRLTALFAALAVWGAASLPAAAEPVTVRAGAHQGYGRVVFNWQSPVPFTADMRGRTLVVRFGRPLETSYDAVVRTLRKYLAAATPGSDGKSVSFTLNGDFGMRSFDIGRAVVVDVLDRADKPDAETSSGSAPAGKQAPPSAAGEAPLVGVRTGAHKGYTRIVFDWPRKVGYRVDQEKDTVTVAFDRQARIDLKRLRTRPPKFIQGAAVETRSDGVSVTLKVPETSRVRHFRSGSKVVVDVMAPGPKTAPKPQEPAKKAVAETKTAATKTPSGRGAPQSTEEAPSPQAAKPPPAAPAPQKPVTLTPGKPKLLRPEGTAGKSDSQTAAVPATPPSGAAPGTMPPADATGKPVAASVQASASAVTLRFDWPEPVAAAVFRRAGYLWVVFGKASSPDVAALAAKAGNAVRSIQQVPAEQATALRLRTIAGINPALRRDGLAWILELRKQPLSTPVTIQVQAQPNSPVGARVFLSVPEPGAALALADPEVGDKLVVVPVIPLGHGVDRERVYPEFRILSTAQGIVIQPRIDDLMVRPLRQGVEVTSPGRLQISAVTAQTQADAKLGRSQMRQLTRVLDLRKWRKRDLTTFIEEKRELATAIAKAKPSRREKARIELARFYFANRFAAETLAVLRRMAGQRPEIRDTAEFRALRGASKVLMGHFVEASEDLNHPSLKAIDEARFWEAALQAYAGDLPGAARRLRRFGGIIRPYPNALKLPLGLLVAEAALSIGSFKTAKDYLQLVKAETLSRAQRGHLGYLSGRMRELAGNAEAAVAEWEKVLDGPHRPSRARAAMARVELLLRKKQMTPGEAIAEMEKLRFTWRGDEFEFNLLRRLGGLYLQEGDYRNGLRILRQAVTHFRTHEKAAEVTQTMADSFAKLYLEDAADSLAPVTAIALYDEFKELTPSGAKGDELIRKLADRLVSVDLLDRAASLLEAQVEFRLKGEEKAQVGARLALVYILNRKPEKAINVLKTSEMPDTPGALTTQRRHLMARALADMNQTDQALLLLKQDKNVDADLLRVEIYWKLRDWSRTGQALRRLVRAFDAQPDEPLDEKQSEFVLNLATVLTLSGNQRAVNRLRKDYGAAMDATPFRDAFRLIAGVQSLGLVDYRTIGGKVAQAEKFQGFMGAYRERLKGGKLSDVTDSGAGG